MALIQSKYAKGQVPYPYPAFAGVVCAHRFWYTFATAQAVGDILELAPIPQGCRIVGATLDGDDMDTGTAMAVDIGVMTGTFGQLLNDDGSARTMGNEFFAGTTLDQVGGTGYPVKKDGLRLDVATNDRSIGLKITTAAAAFVPGTIGLTLFYATL